MTEKIKGCLISGALGDAYGGRFENMDVPSRNEVWRFSQDTQLTIASCEAYIAESGIQTDSINKQFGIWYRAGRLSGIDAHTLKALVSVRSANNRLINDLSEDSPSSNGAALRIAPFAFILDPNVEMDRSALRKICSITHPDEGAYIAAISVVYAIRLVQNDRQSFIKHLLQKIPDSPLKNRILEISKMSNPSLREIAVRFGSSSFAIESIPLALYAAQEALQKGLKPVMKNIVACGGDVNSICALTGQIAGVYLGIEGIPPEWKVDLEKSEYFDEYEKTIRDFAAAVSRSANHSLF